MVKQPYTPFDEPYAVVDLGTFIAAVPVRKFAETQLGIRLGTKDCTFNRASRCAESVAIRRTRHTGQALELTTTVLRGYGLCLGVRISA